MGLDIPTSLFPPAFKDQAPEMGEDRVTAGLWKDRNRLKKASLERSQG